MAAVIALTLARLLWIQAGDIVFLADADFIRAWRENRP